MMTQFMNLLLFDIKRRSRSSFTMGYHLIFPIVMILLLGYLLSGQFNNKLTSYTYYAFVMLPFCTMVAIITSAYASKEESYAKTAYRFVVSPISNIDIFCSKLVSCGITYSVCNILLLLILKILLHLPIETNLFPIGVLLISETFAVCAIGLYIGLGRKNFIVVKNFLNIPIFIFAILGGTFSPMGTSNHLLGIVFKLSPLTWINRGIFLWIYDKRGTILWITVLFLLLTCTLFTYAGIRLFRREEYLHGDLLSFKK